MPNSIELAEIYLPILDELYKEGAKTAILDAPSTLVRAGATADTILLPKISLQGLGTYARNTGFVAGDATLEWQTHTLSQDRGRSFQIDAMDELETVNTAFSVLASQFLRTQVSPEIDAYRFAQMTDKAKTTAEATLSKTTAGQAIDTALETMNNDEVPMEGRLLFVSPALYTFLKQSDLFVRNANFAGNTGINANMNIETFNGMPIVVVPQTRFYTAITLYDATTGGQEAGGFVKAGAGKDINFLIVHPSAVLGIKKHIAPRVFAPNVNQDADAWKFQYRIYHDLFVPDNKVGGIYVHHKAS
jgi:hypothetical protein